MLTFRADVLHFRGRSVALPGLQLRLLTALAAGKPLAIRDVVLAVYGVPADRGRLVKDLEQLRRRCQRKLDLARLPLLLDWSRRTLTLVPIGGATAQATAA